MTKMKNQEKISKMVIKKLQSKVTINKQPDLKSKLCYFRIDLDQFSH
jgi:hypothetical protein